MMGGPDSEQRLFEQAAPMSASEREAFLRERCVGDEGLRERLLRLLAAHDQAGPFMNRPTLAPGAPTVAGLPTGTLPSGLTRIAGFTILRLIGEGGMGAVYLARQDKPDREVALKVVKSGFASANLRRRFELEAEVLGRLQHPGIAQVFEAGMYQAADGGPPRPYFAMEYIRGEPLDKFIDRHRLGTRDRLTLAAKICDAVQHAHQKGIIHRDLKPGNILVTDEGEPKILDFGVARATDSDIQTSTLRTDIGQLIGTVPYMSPEQVTGDPSELDTRSDVYALGVVIYELLAGKLPYDLGKKLIHEAIRVIREDEPTRLSNVSKVFRGDIETIVAKALEKDKSRRYQSANALAMDIRRYLSDEPIAARPASTWYQLRKFTMRNKGLMAGVAAAFILLITGVAGTSIGLAKASYALGRETKALAAEKGAKEAVIGQLRRSEQVSSMLTAMINQAGEYAGVGRDTSVLREIVEHSSDQVASILKEFPEARGDVLQLLATALEDLGNFPKSEALFRERLALVTSFHGEASIEAAGALMDLAGHLGSVGHGGNAVEMAKKAMAVAEAIPEVNPGELSTMRSHLAMVLETADPKEAERLALTEVARHRAAPGFPTREGIAMIACVGRCQWRQERFVEALETFTEELKLARQLYGENSLGAAVALEHIAAQHAGLKDHDSAIRLCRDALLMSVRQGGANHPKVAQCLAILARSLEQSGRIEEASDVSKARATSSVGGWRNDEAILRIARGEFAEPSTSGTTSSSEAVTRIMSRKGASPAATAQALNELGVQLWKQGKSEDAEPAMRECLRIRRELFPGDSEQVQTAMFNLGCQLVVLDKLEEGASLFADSAAMSIRIKGENADVAGTHFALSECQAKLKRFAEAEASAREGLALLGRVAPQNISLLRTGRAMLARALVESAWADRENPDRASVLARVEEAVAVAEPLVEEVRRTRPSGDTFVAYYEAILGAAICSRVAIAPDSSAQERSTSILRAAELLKSGAESLFASVETIHPLYRRSRPVEAAGWVARTYELWHDIEPSESRAASAAQWRLRLSEERKKWLGPASKP